MENYDELNDCLNDLSSDSNAAQCHGELCGWLCVNAQLSVQQWQESVLGEPRNLPSGYQSLFNELFEEAKTHIEQADFDFSLLMPDDDTALYERLGALGDWCQGFLVGLSHSGLKDLNQLPEDAYDTVNDMMEISQIDAHSHTQSDDFDAAEQQWVELAEYVRMGVLMVSATLRAEAEKTTAESVH